VQEPAQKLINQGMIQGLSAKNSIFVRGFKNDKGELVQAGSDPLFIKGSILTSETVINVIYSSDFFNGEEDDSVQKYHSVIRNYNIPIELIDVDSSILIEKFYDSDFAKNNFHDLILANKFGYWRKIYNKVEFRVYDKLSLEQGVKSDDSMIRKVYVNREVEKMSKSKYNVVTPDDIITEYGADTLRLYEMFLGPLEQSKPWSTQGIEGVHRFLKKLWRLFYDANGQALWNDENPQPAEWKALHKLIKKTADDIESFSFNTTVSSFMICVNELTDLGCHKKEILHSLLICISPYAPHIAEELWHALGNKTSVVDASFPVFNPAYLVENSFNYPISINGKHRTNMEFSLSAPQDEITAIVLKDETVLRWMEGKSARKVVFVKGKIINIVV
jgi:leucyl-tRNA synthetase